MMMRNGIDVTPVVTSSLTFQMTAVDPDRHVYVIFMMNSCLMNYIHSHCGLLGCDTVVLWVGSSLLEELHVQGHFDPEDKEATSFASTSVPTYWSAWGAIPQETTL